MNIKYVSLLSLLFVTGANAMSPGKKLENTRNDFRYCNQSLWRHNCNEQEKAFKNAKAEFLTIHREKRNKGIEASRQCYRDSETRIPLTFVKRYYEKKAQQKHLPAILEAWGSGWIVEALDGRSSYNFLLDAQSTTQFCDKVLEDVMTQQPPCQSSYIEDMMGKGHIMNANKSDINTAKTTLKDLIKKQSQ